MPLVALPTVTDPSTVFDVAIARTEEIVLGIVCASVVGSAIFPNRLAPTLIERTDAWFKDAAFYGRETLSGHIAGALSACRHASRRPSRARIPAEPAELRPCAPAHPRAGTGARGPDAAVPAADVVARRSVDRADARPAHPAGRVRVPATPRGDHHGPRMLSQLSYDHAHPRILAGMPGAGPDAAVPAADVVARRSVDRADARPASGRPADELLADAATWFDAPLPAVRPAPTATHDRRPGRATLRDASRPTTRSRAGTARCCRTRWRLRHRHLAGLPLLRALIGNEAGVWQPRAGTGGSAAPSASSIAG